MTKNGVHIADSCPLCQGAGYRRFPIHYYLGEKRFNIRKCLACDFIFVFPRPTDAEIDTMYSDEYFLHDGPECGAHSMTDYETAVKQGSVNFPTVLGYIRRFKSEGNFFEVGAGMGYFLNYVRSHGYKVSGIEYSQLGVDKAHDQFGLDIACSSFERFPETPDSQDVVFFGDVLEHLVEPLEMLKKAHRMLRREGVVVAEVPSMFNSIIGRGAEIIFGAFGKSKKMALPPYHVNEFTPATLKKILLKAGFQRAVVFQRTKPPATIGLRGNALEKTARRLLQYPNYAVTKTFGIFGDRLVGIAIK